MQCHDGDDHDDHTFRMGAAKALTGGREITEKLIPAVARLAQVGDEILIMIMMVIIMKIMITTSTGEEFKC